MPSGDASTPSRCSRTRRFPLTFHTSRMIHAGTSVYRLSSDRHGRVRFDADAVADAVIADGLVVPVGEPVVMPVLHPEHGHGEGWFERDFGVVATEPAPVPRPVVVMAAGDVQTRHVPVEGAQWLLLGDRERAVVRGCPFGNGG